MKSAAKILLPFVLLVAAAASGQLHPNVERGFLPDKSYELADVDGVNLFNGALNVSIPLGLRYPVNGNLSYQFQLSYATNTWDVDEDHVTEYDNQPPYVHNYVYTYSSPQTTTNAGFGWLLTLGTIFQDKANLVYMSPDGARHCFYDTLHLNSLSENQLPGTVFYTRDGTYLRMQKSASEYVLEFPNGDRHTFDRFGTLGRLKTIADTFGNTVTISYGTRATGPFTGSSQWTIADSTGRQQQIYFRPAPGYPAGNASEVVDYLDLAAFNTSRAEYHLQYATDGAAGFPPSMLVSRRCTHAEPSDLSLTNAVRLPILQSILMPVGSPYEMQYDLGYDGQSSPNLCSELNFDGHGHVSGNLLSLHLPTGATIHYEYTVYHYPGSSNWDPPPLGGDPVGGQYFSMVPGIGSRIVKDRDDTKVLSETEYVPDRYAPGLPEVGQRRLLRRKNGTALISEERNYFSTCVSLGCNNQREYGLPLTRHNMPANGPFLSTEVYLPNASGALELKRSTWVIYEGDGDLNLPSGTESDLNRRVRYTKTVFDDGTFLESTSSNYDGLGHYRQTLSDGNVAPGSNQRTTFTNLNPARGTFTIAGNSWTGTFTMPPVNSTWLLGVFDVERTTENSQTSQSLACFDGNGFLTSKRTYASFGVDPQPQAKDLLAIFHPDAHGNVDYEQYLGGDTEQPPVGAAGVPAPLTAGCINSSSSETFRVGYKYDKGVRSASFYVGANGLPTSSFLSETEIDANTGLPRTRSETGSPNSNGDPMNDGLKTAFVYDALGRLTEENPQGLNRGAERRFIFSADLSTIQVREQATGIVLRESVLETDGLGRVTKETRWIPNDLTASRVWEHDGLGRVTAASFWGSGTPLFTRFEYDGFGRPIKQTGADGAVATFGYTGVSSSTTTSSVRTGGTDSTLTETAATTTTAYDAQGRVRTLTEPNGTITRYTYDVGGHLIQVCADEAAGCTQHRYLTYDNRGFLTGETMPELGPLGNGSATYRYDARGNMVRRTTGAEGGNFDVWMGYDRAGRLERVYEAKTTGGVNRNLKLFTYGTFNTGYDYRNGRVTQATRYNWFDGFSWQVVENYTYAGRDARVSMRDTYDNECVGTASTCNPWNAIGTGTAQKRYFRQSFAYDLLGAVSTIDQPYCLHAPCAAANIPFRGVTNQYDRGWLSSVNWTSAAAPSTLSYYANGMVNEVLHGNQVKDTTELDSLVPLPRPYRITTTNVVDPGVCVAPSFSTQPASQTITPQAPITLSASASGPSGQQIRYQWYIGTDHSTPTGSLNVSSQLAIAPAATTRYFVEAVADAGSGCPSAAAPSETVTITVCTPPSIGTHPNSSGITRGQEAFMGVGASGSATLSFQWYTVSGQTSTAINGATASTIGVSPDTTTQYKVRVWNGCGEVFSNVATITVADPPTVPGLVTATSNGSTNSVSWSASSTTVGIDHYEIRRINGPTFAVYPPATLKVDGPTGLSQFTAYRYQVRAVDTHGIASPWSAEDVTVTALYTDSQLLPHSTPVRGIHIAELRRAVDALRTTAGLAPAWSNYSAVTGIVRAAHIAELRDKVNEARLALGLPAATFLDPQVTPGDLFIKDNILQLRGAAN